MKKLNLVDITELNLKLELKKGFLFDVEKNTIISYLEELKESDTISISTPIQLTKRFGFIFVIFVFGFFSLVFYSGALSDILRVFNNTFIAEDNNFQLLGIPTLFIPAISIFSYLLAGSIMLVADMFFIVGYLVGIFKNWTNYHEQMYALAKKLQETGHMEEFFEYRKETRTFHLKKVSINWEMEWIFPFIFKAFPPYFPETGEISIYLFALISFPLPILIAISTQNLVFLLIFVSIAVFLGSMAFLRARNLINIHRSFKDVQKKLIEHQQEKLLQLLFREDVDPVLIHANQENLYRLSSERGIPTSFPLLPLSILLPIFSAIIGYVILAIENAPK